MSDWPSEWKIAPSTEPPFEYLEELEHAFAILEEVGPRFNTAKNLKVLEEGIFDHSRLRTVVEGQSLHWVTGTKNIKSEILGQLPTFDQSALEVSAALLKLFSARRELQPTHYERHPLPEDALLKQKLVFVRSNSVVGYLSKEPASHQYAHVSGQWARFFEDLGQLETQIEAVALKCLREGRAFCINQGEFGPALIAPDHWQEQTNLKGHSKSQFVLSGKLPKAWLNMHMKKTEIEERRSKVEALRWLQSECRNLAKLGQRMTKAEVNTELARCFAIQMPKLQEEIWKEALQSKWSKAGPREKYLP